MDKYADFSDEELIVKLRNGDKAITDYIMDKYKNLVKSKAKAMFLIGGDNDDLIQEGMIGLFMAINYYDPRKDSSFNTFADICITRRLYSAIQASQRKKNSPLNSYISISEDEQQVFDNMHGSFDINPEEMLINRENVRIINENGGKMPDAIGIPEEMLREAAKMAVCKINIDSDLRLGMTAGIRKHFVEHPDHFDPRQYLTDGRNNIREVVKHKIKDVLGSAGKAE